MLEADSKVWDQNAFNDLMRRGNRADPARPDRLFWCAVHLDAYRAATHLACWEVKVMRGSSSALAVNADCQSHAY